jgi:hypothetical protein
MFFLRPPRFRQLPKQHPTMPRVLWLRLPSRRPTSRRKSDLRVHRRRVNRLLRQLDA